MAYSDGKEDMDPNPDISIEYAVDMDQNEGNIGIYLLIIFLSFSLSELKYEEPFTRDVLHTTSDQNTSTSLKQVINCF